jgi:hypothetical protein
MSRRSGSRGEQWVSLADQRLPTRWKTLADWLENDREFLIWRQQLRGYLADWERSGHEGHALLSGSLLSEAAAWGRRRASEINAAESGYIAASISSSSRERRRSVLVSLALLLIIVGIIAAIAIPSLLRARVSANESAAIGDIRTVISAQAVYASVNCGLYGTLKCLESPASPGCVVDYPQSAPTFLDFALSSLEPKSGYRRFFHPGRRVALPKTETCASGATGFESYAFTVVPVGVGQTGVRAFCGDATGVICIAMDGSAPTVVNGGCEETCNRLN